MNLFLHRCLVIVFLSSVISCSSAQNLIPAFHEGARILFQGDSITDGGRSRNADQNHYLGHGYVYIIAAEYGAKYPEEHLTFLNRGEAGNSVVQLSNRWKNDAIDLHPDILSILVGVNDSRAELPLDQYEKQYDNLLATARTANPDVRLVLCTPFILPVGNTKVGYDPLLAAIVQRQVIVARLAAKYHAALVQFHKVFEEACQKAPPEYWIWDGIHPTYSGHQLMANEWVRIVREFWPAQ